MTDCCEYHGGGGTECCEYHATGHDDWYSSTRQDAIAAEARLTRRGEVSTGDVHLIARLRLGLLDDEHAACQDCGVLDCHTTGLQAALNWPVVPAERLRQDAAYGRIYSVSPDDYIALCRPCHRRLDSWRKALPPLTPSVS